MNSRFLCLLIFFSLFYSLFSAAGNSTLEKGRLQVYFFYSETCSHCKAEQGFLSKMEAKYPGIEVHRLSVSNAENVALMAHMARVRGVEIAGTPATFIGESVIVGYDNEENAGKKIEKMIEEELQGIDRAQVEEIEDITIPFYGKLDPTAVSLPVLTIIVGLLDGFNPCAMYILLFLLALLAHTRSRKKMFLIGGAFIFASGAVYFLFMAAWLNTYLILGYLDFFTKLAAVVALAAGFVNVKDYFFFGKWFSFKVPEAKREDVFNKMRGIVMHNSIAISLAGAIVLAVSVNFIELICTFGFPAVYTRVLSMQDFPAWLYYAHLLLYIMMYILDDLIVFGIALWALNTARLTPQQSKWLKLVSGIIMLWLGLVLLTQPDLLVFG